MKRLQIVAVLALVSLAPSTAFAGVVHEEVGNQGDLPIDPPYPVLALSLGPNSVIGRTSFSGDAVDNFAFSIPSGSTLASITYLFTSSAFIRGSATLTNAMSGFALVMGDGTAPQPGSLLAVQNLDMIPGLCSALVTPCGPTSPNAIAVTLFANALPLGAGIYSFEQRALTNNAPEFITWGSHYEVRLEVVPEPGSSVLFALALAALVRSRRWQGCDQDKAGLSTAS